MEVEYLWPWEHFVNISLLTSIKISFLDLFSSLGRPIVGAEFLRTEQERAVLIGQLHQACMEKPGSKHHVCFCSGMRALQRHESFWQRQRDFCSVMRAGLQALTRFFSMYGHKPLRDISYKTDNYRKMIVQLQMEES